MKNTLYHAPLACSLAARYAAAEGDVPLDIAWLNLRTKELLKGGSLYDINPLGQVSVLALEDGQIINETSAVLMWIQSQSKVTEFRRDPSDPEYFQLMRWISFCSSELHKQIFRVVFYDEATDEVKDKVRALAPARLQVLDNHLRQNEYLVGKTFSAADAYLAWFFVLAGQAGLDHSGYANLKAYEEKVQNRPSLKLMRDEDLSMIQKIK